MAKKYYCDYCDKSFKDDRNIRKKHIEGFPHQKARNEHYAHFKSINFCTALHTHNN